MLPVQGFAELAQISYLIGSLGISGAKQLASSSMAFKPLTSERLHAKLLLRIMNNLDLIIFVGSRIRTRSNHRPFRQCRGAEILPL